LKGALDSADPAAPADAGLLVQTGTVALKLGEIEVFYPRRYTAPPQLEFPVKQAVVFEILQQLPTGFRIKVTDLSWAVGSPPNSLQWRAAGEAPKTNDK
jgi:hypothetical protein